MNGEFDGIAPKVAVILIGTNDIGWQHRAVADTVQGLDAVVAELHLRLPGRKILLVGLLPSDRGASVRQATAYINSALSARYGDGRVAPCHLSGCLVGVSQNGILDTSLFSDPQQVPSEPALHPSPNGQERLLLSQPYANFWGTRGMTVDALRPAPTGPSRCVA
jgi:hypothetical protein